MPQLNWKTGNPPFDVLIFCQVDIVEYSQKIILFYIGKIDKYGDLIIYEGAYVTEWGADQIDRWVEVDELLTHCETQTLLDIFRDGAKDLICGFRDS